MKILYSHHVNFRKTLSTTGLRREPARSRSSSGSHSSGSHISCSTAANTDWAPQSKVLGWKENIHKCRATSPTLRCATNWGTSDGDTTRTQMVNRSWWGKTSGSRMRITTASNARLVWVNIGESGDWWQWWVTGYYNSLKHAAKIPT